MKRRPTLAHGIALTVAAVFLLSGCAGRTTRSDTPDWAIAIHGGAGYVAPDSPDRAAYFASLEGALREGTRLLEAGEPAVEVVERVVRRLEDDPLFNAGRGTVYTEDGAHELDASIMDGRALGCGAVTGVRTVKNPISLARLVMERSEHVFFSGDGAEKFATLQSVERVDPSYFDTPARYEYLQEVLERRRAEEAEEQERKRGTVGCVVLDRQGDLAAGTSTGGLTAKRFGRIGDSPVIGAGTYANNRSCAVSCTGTGEEFIRHTVARDIAALVEYRGMSVDDAAREVVFTKLRPDDGGVIVVGRDGRIALVYSTGSMLRGAADSTGRFDVRIWAED